MTRNIELSAWHELAIQGDVAARKNVTLTMYDVTGDPVVRYHLTNAWPSKLEIGALKSGASSALTGDGHARRRVHPARLGLTRE